jgi:hypothetical protein
MTTIAKDQLNSLTSLQKECHDIPSENSELAISSIVHYSPTKCFWYSKHDCKLSTFDKNKAKDEISFKVDSSYHHLTHSYMRQELPAIRVKDKYKNNIRIAWCHNLGINIVTQAKLKSGDNNIIQTIDNTYHDIRFAFFRKPGMDNLSRLGVGSIPILENWTIFLPALPLISIHPWFYSKSESLSLPIGLFSNGISHVYNLERNVSKLLRMQHRKNENDEWKDIHFRAKYLDGVSSETKIDFPELWGNYLYLSEDELKYNKNCSGDRTFYIEDVIINDSDKSEHLDDKVSVDIKCSYPIKAMFWMGRNETAKKFNNHSNYTTNSKNVYEGWCPIKTSTMAYGDGNSYVFQDRTSDHFSQIQVQKNFSSAPFTAGYLAHCFSSNLESVDHDVGFNINKKGVKLTVQLGDTDPFKRSIKMLKNKKEDRKYDSDEDSDKSESEEDEFKERPKFNLVSRLLIYKKMVFVKNEENSGYTLFI